MCIAKLIPPIAFHATQFLNPKFLRWPVLLGFSGRCIELLKQCKEASVRGKSSRRCANDLFVPIHQLVGATFHWKSWYEPVHVRNVITQFLLNCCEVDRRWHAYRPILDVAISNKLFETASQLRPIDIQVTKLIQQRIVGCNQVSDILLPCLFAQKRVFFFVKLTKRRVNTEFNGPLTQKRGTETVDRSDERLVDLIGCNFQSVELFVIDRFTCRRSRSAAQGCLKALSQFGGGFASESDGCQLIDLAFAGFNERNHSIDKIGCLAGASCSFDDKVLVELCFDASSCFSVFSLRHD